MASSSEYYTALNDAVLADIYSRAGHHSGQAAYHAARDDHSRWVLHALQTDFWTRLAQVATGTGTHATREQQFALTWVTGQVAPQITKTARSAA